MFIRGNGSGKEFRRNDQSFYRGIVVKTDDPLRMNRVKVFIPELSNQPFDNWFETDEDLSFKVPGKNIESSWSDLSIFDEIVKNIPWAEPCYPLMGESGNNRFFRDGNVSTTNDTNFVESLSTNDNNPPSLSAGAFPPSFLYSAKETNLGDAFTNSLGNFSGKTNPYGYSYKPSNTSNKSKGVFGLPQIGSKVWVFHYQGDYNYPIYMGVYHDMKEFLTINNNINDLKISDTYPNYFEN